MQHKNCVFRFVRRCQILKLSDEPCFRVIIERFVLKQHWPQTPLLFVLAVITMAPKSNSMKSAAVKAKPSAMTVVISKMVKPKCAVDDSSDDATGAAASVVSEDGKTGLGSRTMHWTKDEL